MLLLERTECACGKELLRGQVIAIRIEPGAPGRMLCLECAFAALNQRAKYLAEHGWDYGVARDKVRAVLGAVPEDRPTLRKGEVDVDLADIDDVAPGNHPTGAKSV